MVEIYSYDITTHERFARDQKEVEAFRKQYHIPPTGAQAFGIQTKILDFVPKHPAIVLLMQTYQRKMWARFMFPHNYYTQRFASSYVAPSLGSSEKQEADIHKLEAFLKRATRGRYVRRKEGEEKERDREEKRRDPEEEEAIDEGESLMTLLDEGVKETNEMIDFVISRMHQFVPA